MKHRPSVRTGFVRRMIALRMSPFVRRDRPGVTLVELLIFFAIMGVVGALLLPLLYTATEQRLLQQTVATVERNGTQLLQIIGGITRPAQKILAPARGSTGSVLVLQTDSGATNPIIIGVSTGSIILIQAATNQVLSSRQVAIENFVVRNTSLNDTTSQSFIISYTISRVIRLQQPRSYAQKFETAINLFPADLKAVPLCSCAGPSCSNGTYTWQICPSGSCQSASIALDCP
jgi:type II secretory pathway pseudopilin PulG